MKLISCLPVSLCSAVCFTALPAQAEDILSILERQSENPTTTTPTTLPYSYTVSLNMAERDGKDLTEGQAVLRVDPSQAAGSRVQIVSASNPEHESLLDFIKDIEDPEKGLAERVDGFWCGAVGNDSEFDPAAFTVISEDDTQAVLKPKAGKLTELLMQTDDDEEMGKQERKMKKKLADRIDGEVTLAKPSAVMKNFKVTMTRPMTMMVVAKLKTMDIEQSCALAPNGFYRMSTMNMRVSGKAMGSRFGQDLDIRVSDLSPLP